MSQTKNNAFLIVGSIIVAGAVIALGIIFAGGGNSPSVHGVAPNEESLRTVAIPAVDEKDHILGNRDAKVVMVEYSDVGCGHCQNLHETMNRVIGEYEETDFAWVYRHLPFRAPATAAASECVASIAGESAFWDFVNKAMEQARTNPAISEAGLLNLATGVPGVDKEAFEACQDAGTFVEEIQAEAQDAQLAGAQGTPFNVFVLKEAMSAEKESQIQSFLGGTARLSEDRTKLAVSGALEYGGMKALVDMLLLDN